MPKVDRILKRGPSANHFKACRLRVAARRSIVRPLFIHARASDLNEQTPSEQQGSPAFDYPLGNPPCRRRLWQWLARAGTCTKRGRRADQEAELCRWSHDDCQPGRSRSEGRNDHLQPRSTGSEDIEEVACRIGERDVTGAAFSSATNALVAVARGYRGLQQQLLPRPTSRVGSASRKLGVSFC